MDLHISVIADFKTACPDVEVVDWCLSGHAWVMNRKQDIPKVINPTTWINLNEKMITDFQEEYDSFLSSFDGFITGHVMAFAMIYEKYNKPILAINSCRYDMPFCWSKNYKMIGVFNERLQRMTQKGLLRVVSNNYADRLYTFKGTGIQPHVIPSICLYTNIKYSPTKPYFLCYSKEKLQHPLIVNRKDIGNHEWKLLGEFKGIVHFPYEVSTMTMFEHYFAGLPLFFPSKRFFKSHIPIQSIMAYWGNDIPRYFEDLRDTNTWIDLSDIYTTFTGPNIYFFDSVEHLFLLLESFQYIPTDMTPTHDNVKAKWKECLLLKV